jgi:hypothetical protein
MAAKNLLEPTFQDNTCAKCNATQDYARFFLFYKTPDSLCPTDDIQSLKSTRGMAKMLASESILNAG